MGLTYIFKKAEFNYGSQAEFIYRHDENNQGYTLGNRFQSSVWGSYQTSSFMSHSLRLNYEWQGDISGVDKNLAISPNINPTASPKNQGGDWINLLFGTNFIVGNHGATRIAFEFGIPVYQNVNNLQMDRDHFLIGGISQSF